MSPWNESTERKLLLCLVDPEKKPDWAVVSRNMGDGFTGEACRSVLCPSLETPTRILSNSLLLLSSLTFHPSPPIFHPNTSTSKLTSYLHQPLLQSLFL